MAVSIMPVRRRQPLGLSDTLVAAAVALGRLGVAGSNDCRNVACPPVVTLERARKIEIANRSNHQSGQRWKSPRHEWRLEWSSPQLPSPRGRRWRGQSSLPDGPTVELNDHAIR
jgi:hypothetical protein